MSKRPARAGRCLSIEVPTELREALKAAAAERGQSLAEMVRRTLAAAVAELVEDAPEPSRVSDRLKAIEAQLKDHEARISRAEESLR